MAQTSVGKTDLHSVLQLLLFSFFQSYAIQKSAIGEPLSRRYQSSPFFQRSMDPAHGRIRKNDICLFFLFSNCQPVPVKNDVFLPARLHTKNRIFSGSGSPEIPFSLRLLAAPVPTKAPLLPQSFLFHRFFWKTVVKYTRSPIHRNRIPPAWMKFQALAWPPQPSQLRRQGSGYSDRNLQELFSSAPEFCPEFLPFCFSSLWMFPLLLSGFFFEIVFSFFVHLPRLFFVPLYLSFPDVLFPPFFLYSPFFPELYFCSVRLLAVLSPLCFPFLLLRQFPPVPHIPVLPPPVVFFLPGSPVSAVWFLWIFLLLPLPHVHEHFPGSFRY